LPLGTTFTGSIDLEHIPFVDLDKQYQSLKTDIRNAIDEVLESKAFIQGKYAKTFAEKYLELHGGSHGVGCANGTSAITLVLRALGIGPGDEVLVPNNTFIGTLEPIFEVGAIPVLVDSLPKTYTLDLEDLESKITDSTRAVIPVHLYGHTENMNALMRLSEKYGFKIIEDCAQAHMAQFDGKAVGTFGVAGTFSFYPGKNLGAYGDAGFILTESQDILKRVSMLLDHGRTDKYSHEIIAGNFRMDGIQAAILTVKLEHLKKWTEDRLKHALQYDSILKPKGFQVLEPFSESAPVYHLYVVEVSNRKEVLDHMEKQNIACGVHYPIPMSQQPALRDLGYKVGEFPESERAAQKIMSLPIFPELTETQIQFITDEFLKVAKP
jgi:dTDP-4-amino-4,6-dideoxygalactose transaminase